MTALLKTIANQGTGAAYARRLLAADEPAQRTRALQHDLVEALQSTRIVASGPKARGALQAAGIVPAWFAESETSAEIADSSPMIQPWLYTPRTGSFS